MPFCHVKSNARGVSICFKKQLPIKVNNVIKDYDGNMIILDIEYADRKLTLCNIYGSNNDNPVFFKLCSQK